jgi:hypothetical protein
MDEVRYKEQAQRVQQAIGQASPLERACEILEEDVLAMIADLAGGAR